MFKFFLFSIPFFLFSFTLDPQPYVQINTGNTVSTGVSVAGNNVGFMAAWQDNSNNVVTSFSSDNWASWSSPISMDDTTIYKAMVAAKGSVFAVCWVKPDIGFGSGSTVVSFSIDQGITWSTAAQLSPSYGSPGGTSNPPSKICASSQGFMAAWASYDGGPTNVWSNFSADGMTWDAVNAVQVNDSVAINYNEVSVAGNGSGFMVSWLHLNSDTSLYEGYGSFSSDLGATWSSPSLIYPDIGNGTDITLCATNAGFLATWTTNAGDAYSSFSSDNGTTWSSPTSIATGLFSDLVPVMSSGSAAGFVVSYLGLDHNIGARFSSNGLNWNAPVSIVSDGSAGGNNSNLVGVSVVGDNCMFTWQGGDSNAYSSYSPFPLASGETKSPSAFFRSITPNKPRGGLFN